MSQGFDWFSDKSASAVAQSTRRAPIRNPHEVSPEMSPEMLACLLPPFELLHQVTSGPAALWFWRD